MNRSPFAKIGPEPIIDDPRMTLEHLRVYWALASSVPKGTDRCKVGQRVGFEDRKAQSGHGQPQNR